MTSSFRDVPIRRKLRVVILGVCSCALVVACGVLFTLQYYLFRRDFERDLAAVAAIIAANSTAALAFEDADAAGEILGALRAKPHITGAAILLQNGQKLAQIGDSALPESPAGAAAGPLTGWHYFGDEAIYAQPILLDGNRVGTLLLHPDYRSRMNELFRLCAGILVVVLLVSFVTAAIVGWRLERLILDPLRAVSEVSRTIAGKHDYSLRVEKIVDDELGTLTDSFNSMLVQIQQRDQALLHQIAERERAEKELQSVHDQLLEASRQAGMAEVATGVLHNVGNVLNSVNVSATLVAEKLGHARMENLLRATALLREQNGALAEFLTHDERGRLLPRYLAELSSKLARDREDALGEIDLLMRNIEHIKDIVAMQQTYARVGGLIEPLSLAGLIDDALRLCAASFEQHGVQVVREYAPTREVAVDKHKVLQILLNIMRNAKYAMDEADGVSKTLTITLREVGGAFAQVRLTDEGVGIAPESLTRIFSHGFTTRKDGHGFGLHSAALAAQQMGGRLSAESAGLGHGATFILDLPLATAWQPAATPSLS